MDPDDYNALDYFKVALDVLIKHELIHVAVMDIGLKRGRCALSRACLGKGHTSFDVRSGSSRTV